MKQVTVSAKVPAKGDSPELGPVTITINSAESAAEAVEMYGDEAVNSNAFSNWVVTLQAGIRSRLKQGKAQDQIQAEMGESKMGVSTKSAPVDPQTAFIAKFRTATPEQQAEMLAKLQAAAQGE